ncbi:MAG: hypothetical protein MJ107_01295 [Lachnospiraceae bacterium]|nr:hypothetical protein [Lachnospiraceae bacterium]
MDGQMDFLGLLSEYTDDQGAKVKVREPGVRRSRPIPPKDFEQISFDFTVKDAEFEKPKAPKPDFMPLPIVEELKTEEFEIEEPKGEEFLTEEVKPELESVETEPELESVETKQELEAEETEPELEPEETEPELEPEETEPKLKPVEAKAELEPEETKPELEPEETKKEPQAEEFTPETVKTEEPVVKESKFDETLAKEPSAKEPSVKEPSVKENKVEEHEPETVKPKKTANKQAKPVKSFLKTKPAPTGDSLFEACERCWCRDCRHNSRNEGVPRDICGMMMACPACKDCMDENMPTVCEIGNAKEGCRTRAVEEGIVNPEEL